MSEYIDRQAASDALARLCKRVCQYSEKQRKYMCGACPLGDAFTVIEDDLPAADVRPVVQARWQYKTMTVPGGKGQTYAKWCCTACKGKAKERTNFCPNCGAMMEES